MRNQSTNIPSAIWQKLDTVTREKIQEIRRIIDADISKAPKDASKDASQSSVSKIPKQYTETKANLTTTGTEEGSGTIEWAKDLLYVQVV